jgi:hypothetical protein
VLNGPKVANKSVLSCQMTLSGQLSPLRVDRNVLEAVVDSDASTASLLGISSNDSVTHGVASQLVEKFIDPSKPGSYPAFKKTLPLRVVGPHMGIPRAEKVGDNDYFEQAPTDEHHKKLTEENRKKLPLPLSAIPPQASYGVRDAARILEVPIRTLYKRIENGGGPFEKDSFGRIRISPSVLEESGQGFKNKENRKNLVQVIAERSGIRLTSARKYILRAQRKCKTLKAIYRDVAAVGALKQQKQES